MKSDNNESQCYFVQLQFDSYFDGELSEGQQAGFLQHLGSCSACAAEFRYAQTIQDGLLDLPLLDCSEESLLPAHELAADSADVDSGKPGLLAGLLSETLGWLGSAPGGLRFAVPLVLLVIVGTIALPRMLSEQQITQGNIPVAAVQPSELATTPVEYSPEDLAQAIQDLTVALEYLNQVSERTENMVGGRFLIRPLQDRLNASFERVRNNVGAEVEGEDI